MAPPETQDTSKYVIFSKNIPAADADKQAVRSWIESWFTQRDIELGPIHFNQAINKIWWDGEDVRHLKEIDMVFQLKKIGLELYALSIAQDILAARNIDEILKVAATIDESNIRGPRLAFRLLRIVVLLLGAFSLSRILFYGLLNFGDFLG